jgi:hypothetical protein
MVELFPIGARFSTAIGELTIADYTVGSMWARYFEYIADRNGTLCGVTHEFLTDAAGSKRLNEGDS